MNAFDVKRAPQASLVGTTSLPEDLVEAAALRLRGLALLIGGAEVFALIGFLRLGRDIEPTAAMQLSQLTIALISAAIALLASHTRYRKPWLLDLGLVYSVVVAYGIAHTELMFALSSGQSLGGMKWVAVWLTASAILVPASLRKALIAIVFGATSKVGVVAIAVSLGELESPELSVWMGALLPNLLAGMIAAGISRVVHGLSRAVKQARRAGSYELEEKLGEGAMGEVWQARHQMLARPAAIKVIRRGHDRDSEAMVSRFEREARATAELQSPYTVRLFDFGRTDSQDWYYAMELVDGRTLHDLVQSRGPFDPGTCALILAQLCHSLADAHEAGLVHRDVKPANIMLTQDRFGQPVVKVLDFGLVSARQDDPLVTQAEQLLGTPAFMAPEGVKGSTVDHRADIYAVGCVGFWLLTGQLVFQADSAFDMAMKHVQESPRAPSELSEFDIPVELDALLLECLEKAPEERPPSAKDLVERFAELATPSPASPLALAGA